jgi:hypothetical protein
MIQTTSRLSRGARLRRARPFRLYGAVAVVSLLAIGSFVYFTIRPG